jgi:hypothetical protein
MADRILRREEHDRNWRCGDLGAQDDRNTPAGDHHSDRPANEFCRQRRKHVNSIVGPAVLDQDVARLSSSLFMWRDVAVSP